MEAIKKLQNTLLDGHRILLSLSRKKVGKYEDLKELKEKIKAESVKGNNKLLVKNLAFQATKAEVQ